MERTPKLVKTLQNILFRLVRYLTNLVFNLLTIGLSLVGTLCISYGFKTAFTDHVVLGLLLVAVGACLFLLAMAVTKVIQFWHRRRYAKKKELEETIHSDQ